jgi:hypothetical protein
MESSRKPRVLQATSSAPVRESPLAKSVTWCARRIIASVRTETTRSVPPYNGGGTDSVKGATIAIRITSILACLCVARHPMSRTDGLGDNPTWPVAEYPGAFAAPLGLRSVNTRLASDELNRGCIPGSDGTIHAAGWPLLWHGSTSVER